MVTDMKDVDCSRLGTMLHLDILKGEDAVKRLIFQNDIGVNAACMKRLMMDTKGCIQLTSNDT